MPADTSKAHHKLLSFTANQRYNRSITIVIPGNGISRWKKQVRTRTHRQYELNHFKIQRIAEV